MGYILIEEFLFKKLTSHLLLNEDMVQNSFSDKDYWMTGTEACKYLNVSKSMLYAYRRSDFMAFCRIGEAYRYKRADIYKLKARMDAELVESGRFIECQTIIHTEQEVIKAFGKDSL